MGSIYKIEFPNEKVYIGITTTSLEKRKKEHKSCANTNSNKMLHKALRKYDIVDTFDLIEIDTADTLEELCEKEIMYIFEYNSHYIDGYGYNMTYGGDGITGYVFTKEDREKMSKAQKTYHKDNPEAREQASERVKQYYENNPEAREKCSEAQIKRFENPEAREQSSERMKQYYKNNPEAREKNRQAQIKRYENPDARQKCSEAQKKRFKDNPEAAKEHGRIMKQIYENPENKRKRLDRMEKNKPFDILKKDGTFVKTFNYVMDAKEYLKKEHNIISDIKISSVLRGKRKSSAGFIFKYQL